MIISLLSPSVPDEAIEAPEASQAPGWVRECSCNTYMVFSLRSLKLVGTGVPASVLLEPQNNPGLGPKGSPQGAERRAGFFGPDGLVQKMAFEGSPDGFLEEFSRVTTWEGHFRQREQHMQSQGGRRVLAGKGE